MRRRQFRSVESSRAFIIVGGALLAVGFGFLAVRDAHAERIARAFASTNSIYAFIPPRDWVADPRPASFPMAGAIGEFFALESWSSPSSGNMRLVLGRQNVSLAFASDIDGIARTMRIEYPRSQVSKPIKLRGCDAQSASYELVGTLRSDLGNSQRIQQVYTYQESADFAVVATLVFDPTRGPPPAGAIAALRSLCPRIQTAAETWREIIGLCSLSFLIVGFTPILFKRVLTAESFRENCRRRPEANRFIARLAFYWAAILLFGAGCLVFFGMLQSGGQ